MVDFDAQKTKQKNQKPRRNRRLGFMQLEPRIMYDGAGVVTAVHHHHDHDGASADHAQAGAPAAGAVPPTGGDGHWHPYAAPAAAKPMPTVTTDNPSVTFTGTGPAATLDSSLTVSAPGRSGNLTGATVAITSGQQSSDGLSFNNGTNSETFSDGSTITATFDNGVLTLSGKASAIDYQTALQQVQFTSSASNGDPTGGGTDVSRGITWQVTDGGRASAAATTTLAVAEPLPTIVTAVNDPTEIVFIDTQAPDYQLLAAGVKPGIEVVLLNPNTDGVDQIANFLALHPDPNLVTIDIVAHGSDGMLFLGNAVLDNATVGQYIAQLKTIGTALQPGGDLMLYGCDVAANPDGVILLAQITDATGANVAASVGPVGSAAEGGTWTLNATSGPIDATAPFTATTLAAYSGLLDADLFGTLASGLADGILYATDTNGNAPGADASATAAYSGNATLNSALETNATVAAIQLDTAAGLYFVLLEGDTSAPNAILEGSLSAVLNHPTQQPTFTTIFSETGTNEVNAFQVDVADNVIFINDIINGNVFNIGTVYTDKVEVLTFSGANFSGIEATKLIGSETNQQLEGMVVDPLNHAAYFYETAATVVEVGPNGRTTRQGTHTKPVISKSGLQSGAATGNTHNEHTVSLVSQDALFKATWGSNTNPTGSFTAFGQLPIAPADGTLGNNNFPTHLGEIQGLTLDGSTLYFDTAAVNTGSGTGAAGIYSYALGGSTTVTSGVWNGSGAYGTVVTFNSLPGDATAAFVIDAATNKYYVALENGNFGAIYDGSLLSNSSTQPVLFLNTSSTFNVSSDFPIATGLTLDNAPVVTASSHPTPTADEGGSAVTIDSNITVTDSDNADLSTQSSPPAATVQITGNFQTGDKLTIGGNLSGTLDGGAISYAFSGSTMTFTGTATVGAFQTALEEVQFSAASGAPTSPRTITFTASDGALSATATDTVDVEAPPTIGGTGNIVDFYQSQGSTGTTLDGGTSGITVADANGANITSATVTISAGYLSSGDTLGIPAADITSGKITGTNISFSVSGDQLTLTGADTALHYQQALRDVTYDFIGDPTNAGADKTRTITWSVTDADGLTSAGGSTTTLDAFMTPVLAGTDTPTVTATSGAQAADANLTVTDHNTIGSIPVAKVTISNGSQTGDELTILAADLTGTGITAAGNGTTTLTLTGTGSTTAAEFQTVLDDVQFDATSPHNGTRTLTWSFNDDAGGNANASNSFVTSAVAAFGPTVGGTGNTAQYYQSQATATTLDAGVTVTDAGANISSAAVTISSGFLSGDTLKFDNGTNTETFGDGSTVTASQSGGVLTLTTTAGSATAADYQTALESVTYGFSGDPTNAGADNTRSITWSVTDANSQTSPAGSTTTLDVYMTPVLAGTVTPTPTVTSTSGAVTADSNLTVTDHNTIGSIPVATVTISNGSQTGDELTILAADLTGTGITAAGNGTTTLTLTGTGSTTAAEFQTVLDDVQFDATNPNSGTRNLTWSLNDDAGGHANDSNSLTTTVNAAFGPDVTAGSTVTGTEGGSTGTVTVATFTDPTIAGATVGDFSANITWGDGTSSTGTVIAQGGGSFAVTGAHTYAEEGSYPVGVAVTDINNVTGNASDTATIADAPLTAGAAIVTGGVEGVTAATLSATFTDANPGAPTSDFSGTIAWGDGTTSNFTSADVAGSSGNFTVTGSHLYTEDGTFAQTVTINDVGGKSTIDTGTTTVADAPLTAGTATATGGVEGVTAATLTATFSDANPGAPTTDFSGTIDWGDGNTTTFNSGAVTGSNGNFAVTDSHLYADEGTYTTTVTFNDVGGNTTTETATATVVDAPLTAGAALLSGGVEGVTPATLSATFADANTGGLSTDFSGTIAWGDGTSQNFTSADVTGSNGNFTVSGSHLYAEEGTYTSVVTINDVGGSTTTETGTTTVLDAPLTAGIATASGGVEGVTPATLSATFSDANTGALTTDFSGTIAWGDGTTSTFTSADVAGSNGNFTVSGSHLYAEDGTFTATVAINDDGGSTATETGTNTVADAPLTAGTATVTSSVEGVTAATLTATFSDANTAAPTSDFSGTIAWGDGNTTTFTSGAVTGSNGNFAITDSHLYAEQGTYTATVTFNDVGGSTTTETATATVADAPLTAGAVLVSGGVEGVTPATLSATFSDADTLALNGDFSGTIAWGDNTTSNFTSADVAGNNGNFVVSGSHLYAEDGTYTPVVTINDVGGSTATEAATTTILDAPLTAGVATASGGVEGVTAATLSATFTDANTVAPTSDFAGTIAWGDGTTSNFTSADVAGSNGNFTVSGSHLYAEDGTFTPTVTIIDDGGSTATETGTTTVADAPLTAAGGTTLNSTEGATLAATVATFTDANPKAPLSDFTATIDWGDGTSSTGIVTENVGVFSVAGTHTYVASGVYSTNVAIADVGGSAATVTDTIDVVPVAPTITALVGTALTNQKVELQGTGDVGDLVNLYADGNTTTIVGTGHVIAGGTFDITTSATFGDGLHTFTATETDTVSLTSTASSPAFPVTVVHEPPVLTAGGTVTYTQNGPAQPLDTLLTVTDPDSAGLLAGATVKISSGFLAGDVLNADTTGTAITANYDAAHGTLTLTGTDTLADYTQVLQSISFLSTSPNPSNDAANPTRTVSWSVTDGNPTNAVSATKTSTVDVHAVPTVVAGADVDFTAGLGKSVVLDLPIGAFDGTDLTGATVTIASGFQPGEVLNANTAGTGITANYSNGVLTLSGTGTPQEYQQVLSSVTMTGTSVAQSGPATIDWQISDQNHLTSKVATSTVEVTASLTPPPPRNPIFLTPADFDHGHFGDFSGMVTNAQFGGLPGLNFGQGHALYVIHSDVNPTVADNGSIGFDLALNQLEAALGGDVVSVTATLANGQPLPAWLAFNASTGQFAGLVPDDLTGSIDHDGGFDNGQGGSELMTVQVIARDSKGNLAVTDFTINFATPTQHKADRHGWNLVPSDRHHDIAPLHAINHPMDHVLWHDADRVHAPHHAEVAPAGRAGFSDQIRNHGWHAVAAQRMALLDSLRQGVAGWR